MYDAVILGKVSKRFGETQAVDSLDMVIPEGTIYGFLGPNGSGKSTTMKMMIGLVKPDSGSISILGHDPQREPIEVKRLIGYVPETPRLYEFLTANEYIEFLCTVHGIDPRAQQDRVSEFYEAFELTGQENVMMGGFSHGMKQKMAIIGALLAKPRLLILDEPLGGLDPKSAKIMKDLLHSLAKEGVTTIFSTHIMEIADAICDRICIIDHGRKLVEGTPTELRKLGGRSGGSLEEVFLSLTGGAEIGPIVEALTK